MSDLRSYIFSSKVKLKDIIFLSKKCAKDKI